MERNNICNRYGMNQKWNKGPENQPTAPMIFSTQDQELLFPDSLSPGRPFPSASSLTHQEAPPKGDHVFSPPCLHTYVRCTCFLLLLLLLPRAASPLGPPAPPAKGLTSHLRKRWPPPGPPVWEPHQQPVELLRSGTGLLLQEESTAASSSQPL